MVTAVNCNLPTTYTDFFIIVIV